MQERSDYKTKKFIAKVVEIMKINKVTIGGFRNVEKTVLELSHPITALVSLNSYGKSNLLKAIEFGIGFINETPKERDGEMIFARNVPHNKYSNATQYSIDLSMELEYDEKLWIVEYGYAFEWGDVVHKKAGSIISESLTIADAQNMRKKTQYILRDQKAAKYKSSATGRCSKQKKVMPNDLMCNVLRNEDGLVGILQEVLKRLGNMTMHIDQHFDPTEAFQERRLFVTAAEPVSLNNFDDLPRVLNYLRNNLSDKFELIVDAFCQLFPQFEGITTHEIQIEGKELFPNLESLKDLGLCVQDKEYRIYTVEKYRSEIMNGKALSDGAKRILLLLTATIVSEYNGISIIALEEIENCVHPKLVKGLLDILEQFAGNCKIIITSHSPYVVQYLPLENIYVGLPEKCGKAIFETFSKKGEKAIYAEAKDSAASTGEVIFDMLSGDQEDLDYLKNCLRPNVCTRCHAHGEKETEDNPIGAPCRRAD